MPFPPSHGNYNAPALPYTNTCALGMLFIGSTNLKVAIQQLSGQVKMSLYLSQSVTVAVTNN